MNIMTISKPRRKSKWLGWIEAFTIINLTPDIVAQTEIQDATADLLKKSGYAELSYPNNCLCHDQVSYYAVICLFNGTHRLVGLPMSGMLFNKKGELIIKWDAKTIGEQLISLGAKSAYIIERKSFDPAQPTLDLNERFKSWSIYIIGQDLIEKHRRRYIHT